MKRYTANQRTKIKENYSVNRSKVTPLDVNKLTKQTKVKNGKVVIDSGIPLYFCKDQEPVSDNRRYMSRNQKMVNGVNPKTKIAPVIIAPSHDLSYWKANEMITHSAVNDVSQQDAYLSGYAVSTCCGNLENKLVVPKEQGSENYESPKPASVPVTRIVDLPVSDRIRHGDQCGDHENYESPKPASVPVTRIVDLPVSNNIRYGDYGTVQENFKNVSFSQNVPEVPEVPVESGWVNTQCGYNPQQTDVNLPSNLPVGNCPQDSNMKEYNKSLFTSNIQPTVFKQHTVNEPINANIGISFQQQFEPVSCKRKDGNVMYKQLDPSLGPYEVEQNNTVIEPVNVSNVYDPRFNGYGTSYRTYNEPVTGQPRFFYDDINAIRMPNYIIRSKIDHLSYADSYGAMKPGQERGNILTPDIRGLANDSWMRKSLQFRNDMSERLMRKRNAELWQVRQYPKSNY